MLWLQLLVVLLCLLLGTRYGGLGLGLISGFGLVILVFIFHLPPGDPPISVMLTILAVISSASVLQAAGGLDVLMRFAERLLRRHPSRITLLAPLTTWTLTMLCGTGHVVYTMFPIIEDIALSKNIRPERPMAAASVASQVGITASPVSVATVTLASLLATHAEESGGVAYSIPQILQVTIPATLCGVIAAAFWSMKRGKDLDKDPEFQEKLKDPTTRDFIYAGGSDATLLDKVFPKTAYISTWIFFGAIGIVVLLGAFEVLRPEFVSDNGEASRLSMNLIIQMLMLVAGALILIVCKVPAKEVPTVNVFSAGMVALISVFGVAWMSETFFGAHIDALETSLSGMVEQYPWTYAIALFLVSKLVNSQGAAIAAMAPIGLAIGVDPVAMIGFASAAYGYFILPTYPSDLAAIGFDRTGTTRIGKFIINHSFIVPGLICVGVGCLVGSGLAQLLL
ncbi:anaerobic C4-dicarboxylate transporter [Schaalia suimastitidis]|uniref:anaerobic C4-dicarboxylate transporter n=1 Tax=Schaalia suimastitidis TaxID=121163 RepID=UPI0004050D41|nr:anaerobic C4-dicarboxylate transporter [Schaalia suimastitidis]